MDRVETGAVNALPDQSRQKIIRAWSGLGARKKTDTGHAVASSLIIYSV